MSLRFGEWELDSGQRRLLHGADAVHVSPKALQLLTVLLERAPNAVSKQEIHDELWPATFVSEANLPTLVRELRAALGDEAQQSRYIRTVHRYGYAFSGRLKHADVRSAPGRYRMMVAGTEVPLAAGVNEIGRTATAAVFIDDASVSRTHARIIDDGAVATLEDLGSKNGTFVNGQRIAAPTVVHDRDVIGVGTVAVVFREVGVQQPTITMQ